MQQLSRIWQVFLNNILANRHTTRWSASLVFGVVAALFPVIGPVTLVSVGVCWLFRLNTVLVVLVLYALYPLQLLMIVPFYYLGDLLWPGAALPLSNGMAFGEYIWELGKQVGSWASRAIVGWALLMLPVALLVYRWSSRKKQQE